LPRSYLLSIREEAEKFGICAIQPPPSWKPPFMLDLNKLRFPTRVQKINELLVRKVQRLKFMKALTGFCDGRGTPLKKIPDVSGRAVDLHLLYTLVRKRGGFEQTCAARRWSEVRRAETAHAPTPNRRPPTRQTRLQVAEQMNMHHAARSHLAQALKKHYHALLLPFERCEAGLDPPPAPKPSVVPAAKPPPPPAAQPAAPPAAAPAEPAGGEAAEAEAEAAAAEAEAGGGGADPMEVDIAAAGAASVAEAAVVEAAVAEAAVAEAAVESSGGGLMAKRGLKYSLPAVGEVVQLTGPKGVQRSNADVEEVLARDAHCVCPESSSVPSPCPISAHLCPPLPISAHPCSSLLIPAGLCVPPPLGDRLRAARPWRGALRGVRRRGAQ